MNCLGTFLFQNSLLLCNLKQLTKASDKHQSQVRIRQETAAGSRKVSRVDGRGPFGRGEVFDGLTHIMKLTGIGYANIDREAKEHF